MSEFRGKMLLALYMHVKIDVLERGHCLSAASLVRCLLKFTVHFLGEIKFNVHFLGEITFAAFAMNL